MTRKNNIKNKPWNRPEYFHKAGISNRNNRMIPYKAKWLKDRRRHWIRRYLEAKGCTYCGFNDPIALEFDHIDPSQKLFGVMGNSTKGVIGLKNRLPELFAEIRKCRILCCNCHKVKTTKEKQTANNKTTTYEDQVEAWNHYNRK